ncbi:MAG: GNAT family N-acetyltransferase [Flavobacteriales bacterium]|nr:GNAT family N-acetyltransferase [Flavobacteriales bacterium]
MIIRSYGVQLSSLIEEELELVRQWRNSKFIKEQMLYKEYISSIQQLAWFQSLGRTDLYLMIESKSEKIGVINIKKIDWQNRSGEAGIFIGSEKHRNTMLPILAIFALMDTAFDRFNFNTLSAKVLRTNQATLNMNLELGYQIQKEHSSHFELLVSATNYKEQTTVLKSKIDRLILSQTVLELSDTEKSRFNF